MSDINAEMSAARREELFKEIAAAPLAERDLFRAQRDWLIKECARVGVTVNVLIGAPLERAYQLVNTEMAPMKLSERALQLCYEVEKLPASEAQTKLSIMASNLQSAIRRYEAACNCGCHKLNPGVDFCSLCLPNHTANAHG